MKPKNSVIPLLNGFKSMKPLSPRPKIDQNIVPNVSSNLEMNFVVIFKSTQV